LLTGTGLAKFPPEGSVGHLYKLARASGVTAVIDAAAVPYLDGAREAAVAGHISGGTRRILDWVAPRTRFAGSLSETERLLLAGAQTSGGLLVAGRSRAPRSSASSSPAAPTSSTSAEQC